MLCVFSMLPVQTKTRPPCGYHPNHRHSYSECLFVALRLRGVERRGHTESLTKLIRQIPVTSKTFAPLRSSARALWTAAAISVICLLPICIPLTTSTSFSPLLQALFLFFFFWPFCSTLEIFMPCIFFLSKPKAKGHAFKVILKHIHFYGKIAVLYMHVKADTMLYINIKLSRCFHVVPDVPSL